jgi:hypothetical protein
MVGKNFLIKLILSLCPVLTTVRAMRSTTAPKAIFIIFNAIIESGFDIVTSTKIGGQPLPFKEFGMGHWQRGWFYVGAALGVPRHWKFSI